MTLFLSGPFFPFLSLPLSLSFFLSFLPFFSMTQSKDQGQQDNEDKQTKDRSSTTWAHLEVLNQMMAPTQILTGNELQHELDFYANTQFRYANDTIDENALVTPTLNINHAAFLETNNFQAPQRPYRSNSQPMNQQTLNNLALFLEQQQRPSSSNMDMLLGHEPVMHDPIDSQQQQRDVLYPTESSSSPVHRRSMPSINPFSSEQSEVSNDHSDRFATLFATPTSPVLNTNNDTDTAPKKTKAATQKEQQFRFRKNSVGNKGKKPQPPQKQPLDVDMLTQHNMLQEMTATRTIKLGDTTFTFSIDSLLNDHKGKGKQKESISAKKSTSKNEEDMEEDEESDQHESDKDEDRPVIGDGALSFSSIGSNGSQNSQKKSTLTKDDKRRRNTAASARFRIKKKMREQALQKTAYEMTEKAQMMESKVHELEREIKWLKALVVEKNETRLEQLMRERPSHSTAFPSPSSSFTLYPSHSSSSRYHEDD
ncbi:uncharacterized protein B0P05DRAFT_536463 [Gilbertella persicaria]|uniref:uncharacterized protein n=1 Tax=Gilbertella persicaria TaxID=101096 RepID=UPI00221EF677|nr:uncharacterized protein B0P05DRAFT_536463 [Gilbertella persicaria]KAI8083200.1 hypothetical protein B0P05DRAFT_536463 [Gilbertella persicaria]